MMRPSDLVAAALPRLKHAETLLGPVDIVGITELSPCWRPLLQALAVHTPVRWIAGPRTVPFWLGDCKVKVERSARLDPAVSVISASTAYHEALEALRWARELVLLAGIDRGYQGFVPEMLRELNGNITRTRPELLADMNAVMTSVIVPEFMKRTQDMTDQAARIVASSMTDDELKETVTFLKTPGGKKYIEMQPQVMNGVVSSLDAWNRQLSVEMMVRVRAEMKKKGHDL